MGLENWMKRNILGSIIKRMREEGMFATVPFAMKASSEEELEKYSFFEAARNFADKFYGRNGSLLRKSCFLSDKKSIV